MIWPSPIEQVGEPINKICGRLYDYSIGKWYSFTSVIWTAIEIEAQEKNIRRLGKLPVYLFEPAGYYQHYHYILNEDAKRINISKFENLDKCTKNRIYQNRSLRKKRKNLLAGYGK